MKIFNGIDVSEHQGIINWGRVKQAGIDYVILRAGYGKSTSQIDKQFEANYKNAKANGIKVGAYWYSYARTVQEAEEEARTFLALIRGKQFEYPVYFDIEEAFHSTLNSGLFTDICKRFCDTLEANGYFAGIYSFASMLENKLMLKDRYAIWVAHIGVEKTSYSGQYGMWQFSHTGKKDGISGNVDLNRSYIDYEQIIKTKGLNGFSKSPTEQVQKVEFSATSKPIIKEKICYTVRSGDNLTFISKRYGTTINDIVNKNKAKYPKITPNYIQIGWVLEI